MPALADILIKGLSGICFIMLCKRWTGLGKLKLRDPVKYCTCCDGSALSIAVPSLFGEEIKLSVSRVSEKTEPNFLEWVLNLFSSVVALSALSGAMCF